MTVTHEQLLADIERQVASDGAGPDEIDARIAAELGVPADYYFAYLLVWAAVERHRELLLCQHTDAIESDQLEEAGGTPLQRAQSLADTIGWAASTIYGETAGDGHRQVNTVAAQLIAAALQLRANLRQLDTDRDADLAWEASAPTRGTSGRGVGIDGR